MQPLSKTDSRRAGIPGNPSRQTALFKAVSGTRAALQVAACKHSDEGVARAFQNFLALLLNLFYKKERLQYHRICSKILMILSSFLKTRQQLVLHVANAPTILCAKVRTETIREFIRQVEKYQHHPKLPWDGPHSLSITTSSGHLSRTSEIHGQHWRLLVVPAHLSSRLTSCFYLGRQVSHPQGHKFNLTPSPAHYLTM